jgi:Domain of unknown function (DUF6471)
MPLHIVVIGKSTEYGDVLDATGGRGDAKDMVTDKRWQERAKGLLKAELKRRGFSYRDLSQLLEKIGVSEGEANIANKISRGGFSAVFLLQCLEAMGCKNVSISTD